MTGYDHFLFLLGIIFFLYKMKDIGIYVSLFAIGHSTTMLAGVSFNFGINSYIRAQMPKIPKACVSVWPLTLFTHRLSAQARVIRAYPLALDEGLRSGRRISFILVRFNFRAGLR